MIASPPSSVNFKHSFGFFGHSIVFTDLSTLMNFQITTHDDKVGCVLLMVIWSEKRMGRYRDSDYREHAPHFTILKDYLKTIFRRIYYLRMRQGELAHNLHRL